MASRALARLLITLAVLGTAAPVRADGSADWRLVEKHGAIDAVDGGALPITVVSGATLRDGTVLLSGSDGHAVLQHLDETIVVQPNTRLVLTRPEGGKTRIEQTSGAALYTVGKQRSPHFSVETPWLAATVRGTSFFITVEPGRSQVSVREGIVEVASAIGEAVTMVSAGASAVVSQAMPDRVALTDQRGYRRLVERHEASWRKQTAMAENAPRNRSQIEWRKTPAGTGAATPGLRHTIDLSGTSLPVRQNGNWAIVDSSGTGVRFTPAGGTSAPTGGARGVLEFGAAGTNTLSTAPLIEWKWKRSRHQEGTPWGAIAVCAGVMGLFMLLSHMRNARRLRRGGLAGPVRPTQPDRRPPREVTPVTRGSRQRIY